MNGELAQMVALVGHGNAFLADFLEEPPELLDSNSTFQSVSSVEFRFLQPPEVVIGTATWFTKLRRRGVGRLALAVTDPVRADGGRGWLGGGTGLIHQTDAPGSQDWSGKWSYAGRGGATWRVAYESRPTIERRRAVAVVAGREALAEAIDVAEAFTRRARTGYVDTFKQARRTLSSARPKALNYPGMLPDRGYQVEAHQLLAAATRAWVFGGAGSWTDVLFADDELAADYDEVTAKLYLALLDAIVSAANAFAVD